MLNQEVKLESRNLFCESWIFFSTGTFLQRQTYLTQKIHHHTYDNSGELGQESHTIILITINNMISCSCTSPAVYTITHRVQLYSYSIFTLLNESTTSLFLPGDQTGTNFFIFIFTVFKKRSKDRNVSDDYSGVAMGASILREKSEKGEIRI